MKYGTVCEITGGFYAGKQCKIVGSLFWGLLMHAELYDDFKPRRPINVCKWQVKKAKYGQA